MLDLEELMCDVSHMPVPPFWSQIIKMGKIMDYEACGSVRAFHF